MAVTITKPRKSSSIGFLKLLKASWTNPDRVWATLNALLAFRSCRHSGTIRLYGRVRVSNAGTIILGNKVLFESRTVPTELVTMPEGRIEIGDGAFINYGTSISAHQLVKIGKKCQIGTYALLMDNDYHQVENKAALPPSAPIVLGDGVWLGARVIILKGVTIGDGAVIGAGSVVTRNIPPRSVAVGVPARVVKTF